MKRTPLAVLMLALSPLPALAASTDLPPASVVGEPEAAFNEDRYQLGYDIYLASGNLAAAYRVAEKAVREQPADLAWRKRWAQVALWLGKPDVALANWQVIAERSGSEEAWQQVGKLGRALSDDEAMLQWQRRELQRRPGDVQLLTELVAAYERVGRPDEAFVFLGEMKRRYPQQALYESEALLAERNGRDELALADLRWLNTHAGPQEGWLLRAAALQYQRGDLQGAQRELATADTKMPDSATQFWWTRAELARLLGNNEDALTAYGHLYASGKASVQDLLNYASLLQPKQPLDAARLQAEAFKRGARPEAASSAIQLWTTERHPELAEAFLASLTPEERDRLQGNVSFLEARGHLRETQGRWQEAMRDYAAGLTLDPQRGSLQQAWLAQQILHGRADALRQWLLEDSAVAERTPELWDLWAAGWARLDDPVQALPWLQRRHQAQPEDALGTLAYADGLRRAGRPDAAQTLERRVWKNRDSHRARLAKEQRLEFEQALINLELPAQSADVQQQRLRTLLHQQPDSVWVRDLALNAAWNSEAADSLPPVLSRRLPAAPLPAWSPLLQALGDGDKPALDELLATRREELPIYDRVEAAQRLDRFDLAATMAFESAEIRQDDDEMHRRFQERAWNDGSWADLSFQHDEQGSLVRTPLVLAWKGHLDGNRALRLRVETAGLSSDPAVLRLPFDQQQRVEFGFTDTRDSHAAELWLTALDSLDSVLGLRGKMDSSLSSGVSGELRAGLRQDSIATSGLRVAGQRDFAGAGLAWLITGRDSVALDMEYSRFAAQGGGDLGSTLVSSLNYSHRLFSGERDWTVKTGVSNTGTSTASVLPSQLQPLLPVGVVAGPEYFLPASFTQFSLALAFGENAEQNYQRGWRSFWEIGLTQDAETGIGYDYRWGLLGRVLGRDRLRFYIDGAEGAQGNGEKTQTFNVDYRLYY